MNRYTAQGIAMDALAGRRVLVVSRRQREARLAFEEMLDLTGEAARDVIAANGRELIQWPNGGSVAFVPGLGHSMRGMTADTVFLDDRTGDDPEVVDMAVACITTSSHGEIIRA